MSVKISYKRGSWRMCLMNLRIEKYEGPQNKWREFPKSTKYQNGKMKLRPIR